MFYLGPIRLYLKIYFAYYVYIKFLCFVNDWNEIDHLKGAHQLVASQSNSKGRAFMLAFLPNFNMTTNSSLLVTTDAATTVHIYIAATGNHTRYVISKDSSLHIKVNIDIRYCLVMTQMRRKQHQSLILNLDTSQSALLKRCKKKRNVCIVTSKLITKL